MFTVGKPYNHFKNYPLWAYVILFMLIIYRSPEVCVRYASIIISKQFQGV